MDINLEKYRFGRTGLLIPSCYAFGTYEVNATFVYTTCQYAKLWFENEGVTLLHYQQNMYHCFEIYDVNIIRGILQAYWDDRDFICSIF